MQTEPEPDVACTPKQKPPVEQEIDAALRGLETLEGVVVDLVERLDPVTNQIPPADGPGTQDESAGSSKVYHALEQINARVRNTTQRLKYLISALEV